MEAQFDRLGIPATFFDAVTVPEDSVQSVKEYDEKRRLFLRGFGLTAGEVGCYLSHRAVWKAFLASDNNVCCVIEDDALFRACFLETIGACRQQRALGFHTLGQYPSSRGAAVSCDIRHAETSLGCLAGDGNAFLFVDATGSRDDA